MDGLRYGSSPPRQVLSKAFLSQSQGEASAKALPLARLRPPAFDTGKRVSNLGLRDHDRTIGLERRFPRSAAPLHVSDRAPPPVNLLSRFRAPETL